MNTRLLICCVCEEDKEDSLIECVYCNEYFHFDCNTIVTCVECGGKPLCDICWNDNADEYLQMCEGCLNVFCYECENRFDDDDCNECVSKSRKKKQKIK